MGKSHIHLSNILNTDAGKVGLRVYLGNRVADAALLELMAHKDAIENEVGTQLQWNPNPENRDKIISLIRDIDLGDKGSWPAQIDWLVDMNAKFRSAFMPLVKNLTFTPVVTQPTV